MNLRWLFGNFTDPQYKLSRRHQFRLSNLAHARHVTSSAFAARSALIVAPFLILLLLLEPALEALGQPASTSAYALGILILILLFWPWSAWMLRSLYVRPIRRVMRSRGYDLCINCGYELRGLDASITRCPECGSEREATSPPDAAREPNADSTRMDAVTHPEE